MTKPNIASLTRKRLSIMTSTTDGFIVAEADLKLRGPGDLEGTLQSGDALNLRIANIASDGRLIQIARDTATELLETDPTLSQPQHGTLLSEMHLLFDKTVDWSMIS